MRRGIDSGPRAHPFMGLLSDWRQGLALFPLWSALAIEDLRDRYRRTLLGLTWIIFSFALFVGVKVLVFGLWTYINAMIMDGCTAYIHARPWILGTAVSWPNT